MTDLAIGEEDSVAVCRRVLFFLGAKAGQGVGRRAGAKL